MQEQLLGRATGWASYWATFVNLPVTVLFSECLSIDFAFQILSYIFLRRGFLRSF